MTKIKDFNAALDVKLHGEFDDETVRSYLCLLLTALWEEKEAFNGKYPFGDSGWEYDLYAPLVKAGFIKGSLDEYADGHVYVEDFNKKDADAFIEDLILFVFTNSHRSSNEDNARV